MPHFSMRFEYLYVDLPKARADVDTAAAAATRELNTYVEQGWEPIHGMQSRIVSKIGFLLRRPLS